MTPARSSPSTRTLGIQLVAMSTVLALIARMFLTASRPMPVIATSRNATTVMILLRIEYLASIAGISWFWARWARLLRQSRAGGCVEGTVRHDQIIARPE